MEVRALDKNGRELKEGDRVLVSGDFHWATVTGRVIAVDGIDHIHLIADEDACYVDGGRVIDLYPEYVHSGCGWSSIAVEYLERQAPCPECDASFVVRDDYLCDLCRSTALTEAA